MTPIDWIISLLCLIALFIWLLRRLHRFQACAASETTRPLTPAIPLLKPFIYLWWLLTGLWPERIDTVRQAEHPVQHRLSIWVHRIALLLIAGLCVTALYQLLLAAGVFS